MMVSPVVAVVTPFDSRLRIDFGALGAYLDLLADAGVRSVLVNGTTGEFASLTVAERSTVVEFCREKWPWQLIAHAGASAAADAVAMVEHANDHADALALIAPFFFAGVDVDGVERFFDQVLASARIPALLYNFPRHTQLTLDPLMVGRLAVGHPLLIGVKDSGKDRAVTRGYQQHSPGLQVLVGDDSLGAKVADLGFDGVVTGAGGPVAELPVAIAAAITVGDRERAERRQAQFDHYTSYRRGVPISDIAFTKAALSARLPGFPAHVRAPLVTATDDCRDAIRAFIRDEMSLDGIGHPPEA
ncbi:dihydrodipicolinate synthase family protein [Nocardia cyriacigeorgica]|uniref:dihydrodipicolinate synthase family protein n=1 Tax=Nocardia cyriacigeorgica TaxID=135487 RepID=UPI00189357FD|nr:dihydrodipicolinate synthase family protein [Nocardia cyriacigeorgica]MBF6102360.1 dihydrodipicolinate synthase family protein [Nocardia cyriacigeorgica]MBF6163128.1 dihydrodipicolinate synthase family protein [Nocardia cyriacigeorgica]MBF6202095.1 dihydrodipicolinate synthase family protein [Nocardia cyriacigeorgica]MBF6518580.1 dihydrodipicolinate synthase family protein [Nocardia cyriacigeorgica]